jgi:hypothetical protein
MKTRKEKWQSDHRSELLRQVAAQSVKDDKGTPASTADIEEILASIRAKNLNSEDFQRIMTKAREAGKGKINLATVQTELGAIGYEAGPPPLSVTKTVPPPGKGPKIIEFGPLTTPRGMEGGPGAAGITIRIPGT